MLFVAQRGNRDHGEPMPTRRQNELRGLAELVQAELERAADAQVFEVTEIVVGSPPHALCAWLMVATARPPLVNRWVCCLALFPATLTLIRILSPALSTLLR